MFEITEVLGDNAIRLKAGPYVGNIRIPGLDVLIKPPSWLSKLSPPNFMYMLSVAYTGDPKYEFLLDIPAPNNFSTEGLIEPIYESFVNNLESALKKGIYREYVSLDQNIKNFKGNVIWSKQVRNFACGSFDISTKLNV
ncbi:MAG: hypothetical protein KFF50_02850, partial [Desulfatitalea sp.]|nr:hypothetical protein [Desulfatitalea sp.]